MHIKTYIHLYSEVLMRTIYSLLTLAILGSSCATTSRDKLLRDMSIGAAMGAGAGAYANSQNKDPNKSGSGTILLSAFTGSLIAAAWDYIFINDDQAFVAAERDKFKFDNDQLKAVIRQGNYDRNIPRDVSESTVKLGEPVPDGFNFGGLREDGCQVREFSLGMNDDPFVAVSRSIIMPRLSYYVLFSKDKKHCVKEDGRGYLDAQIPGLGKALLDRAEYTARKMKEGVPK